MHRNPNRGACPGRPEGGPHTEAQVEHPTAPAPAPARNTIGTPSTQASHHSAATTSTASTPRPEAPASRHSFSAALAMLALILANCWGR